MKQCSRCHKDKELNEFFNQPRGAFGVTSQCKECCREYKRLVSKGKDGRIQNKLKRTYKSRSKGSLNTDGYIVISMKGHPNAKTKQGHIFQHRYVMAEYLGRPLMKGETVHHKNGIRTDNRIENLELRSTHHGPGSNVDEKIEWCINFLNLYGYKVEKIN